MFLGNPQAGWFDSLLAVNPSVSPHGFGAGVSGERDRPATTPKTTTRQRWRGSDGIPDLSASSTGDAAAPSAGPPSTPGRRTPPLSRDRVTSVVPRSPLSRCGAMPAGRAAGLVGQRRSDHLPDYSDPQTGHQPGWWSDGHDPDARRGCDGQCNQRHHGLHRDRHGGHGVHHRDRAYASGVANTIVNSVVATSGGMYSLRLPAGWFIAVTATTATWTATAVVC